MNCNLFNKHMTLGIFHICCSILGNYKWGDIQGIVTNFLKEHNRVFFGKEIGWLGEMSVFPWIFANIGRYVGFPILSGIGVWANCTWVLKDPAGLWMTLGSSRQLIHGNMQISVYMPPHLKIFLYTSFASLSEDVCLFPYFFLPHPYACSFSEIWHH